MVSSKIETINPEFRQYWDSFFKDKDLMEEIQKDVRRTRSNLNFFSKPLDVRDMPKDDGEAKRLEMQFETTYLEMTD